MTAAAPTPGSDFDVPLLFSTITRKIDKNGRVRMPEAFLSAMGEAGLRLFPHPRGHATFVNYSQAVEKKPNPFLLPGTGNVITLSAAFIKEAGLTGEIAFSGRGVNIIEVGSPQAMDEKTKQARLFLAVNRPPLPQVPVT